MGILLSAGGCGNGEEKNAENPVPEPTVSIPESAVSVTEGTEEYRGFVLDNVLHSENDGDIHYHLYVTDSYDGSEPYALFFTLPGYEGL